MKNTLPQDQNVLTRKQQLAKARYQRYIAKRHEKRLQARLKNYPEYYEEWYEHFQIPLYKKDGTIFCKAIELLIQSKPKNISKSDWYKILEELRLRLSEQDVKAFNRLKRLHHLNNHKQKYPEKVKEQRKKYNENNKEKIKLYQHEYSKKHYQENKEQLKQYQKDYNQENKEKVAVRQKNYRNNNWEKIKNSNRKLYHKDKEKQRQKRKAYKDKDPEKVLNYHRNYHQENKDRIKVVYRSWYERNKSKVNERAVKKRKEDPIFRFHSNLRGQCRRVVKELSLGKKPAKTFDWIGCTPEQLKAHFESLFQEGMTWENYGEWHVDHIRPICSFLPEEWKEVNHYTNLRPLWAEDNLAKITLDKQQSVNKSQILE